MTSFRTAIMIGMALGAGALAQAQDRGYGQWGYGQYGPDYRYGERGDYGRGRGYDARGEAFQVGRADGERDGREDAWRGHSFRPTHSGNYHHADRGYHHEFGPKQWYKDAYRSGYMEGYRAGYSTRARRW